MPYVGPPLATAMRNLETAVDVSFLIALYSKTHQHTVVMRPVSNRRNKANIGMNLQTCCFELIDRVPDCKTEATKQKDSLDFTLADAIKNWSSQSQLGVVA
jgi:hypothetical protein